MTDSNQLEFGWNPQELPDSNQLEYANTAERMTASRWW